MERPAWVDSELYPFEDRWAEVDGSTVHSTQSRVPMHVFPRAIIGETDWLREVEQGLTRLDDKPALILWPTRDQAFGDKERERWEQTFADHRTVTLEGAGHYIGEDAPEEIVTALRDWRSGSSRP